MPVEYEAFSGWERHRGRRVRRGLSAHRQKEPTAQVPSFKVIHDAIYELGVLLQRYVYVVIDTHQLLDPAVAGDVMGPFRVAWLPSLPTSPRKPVT